MPPEIPEARILANSRRKAFDWSLVLLSQGIEATIEFSDPERRWMLLVASENHPAALEAIRLYELENRRWPWQRKIFPGDLLFDWSSLAWVALLCFFFWLQQNYPDSTRLGLVDTKAVSNGEAWRLFTAVWLHADLAHLAGNSTIGLILLGLVQGRYGTGLGLLLAYLSGVAGNAIGWLMEAGQHHSLGASGMVMGALGLLAGQSLALWRLPHPKRRHLLASVSAGVMLFILFGIAPGTDIQAHAGGFLAGIAMGGAIGSFHNIPKIKTLQALSGFAFAVLVIWPWFKALHFGDHP